ncbi:hypothetical protein COO91_03807 [Nostoc flagelliforme CCNUN1]|uniref:Uncharacterized protein n=1 Tax=Nostoc flagelliforme CCNUN1 TaxID=2038116 RepID=A0A2K8SST4_9NOSO|nr:hypothetical protein COO91_03807 [Nostoc flagelliforme CCNUN1]
MSQALVRGFLMKKIPMLTSFDFAQLSITQLVERNRKQRLW